MSTGEVGRMTVRPAAIQAPIDLSSATRVGPRVYRKQVLAKRTINYPMPDGSTQVVDFTEDYLRDLAAAYNDGAYDLVPFQLADPNNRHNEDPRQYGGRVIGAEVTDDGLDMLIELSEEAAELVERTGGRLGVSPRIKAVRHVDGRTFKRAIRHVLGTLDPRQQNLRGWEPVVDLAGDDPEPVLDLSSITYQEGSTMPRIIDLSTLSDEQLEAFESFAANEGLDLSALEADDAIDAAEDEPDESGDDEGEDEQDADDELDDESDDESDDEGEDEPSITDDELEALIDAELATEGISLSDDTLEDALDLATGDDYEPLDTPDAQAARMRFQLASQRLAAKGIPPAMIDLAEPILSLPDDDEHSIDLSSPSTGEALDVRRIVRDMLEAAAGTVDLSTEHGYSHDEGHSDEAEGRADAWLDHIENN